VRIRVDHSFYLRYLLPLLDQPLALNIDFGEFSAAVWAWDRSHDLFPNGIAASLAEEDFELRSVAWPQAAIRHRVRDHCMDRMDVSVSYETAADPLTDPSAVDLNLQRAISAANAVLGHLRTVAGVPGVQLIERYWKPGHDRFATVAPHLQIWLYEDGTGIPMFDGVNSMRSSGAIRAPETGRALWADFAQSISTGRPPLLERTLLLDAEQHLMGLDLRAAILCICSSIESRITSYAVAQSVISKTQRKAILGAPVKFAERHFHALPLSICQRSLQTEQNDVYEAVQRVYDQRNSLMHGGLLTDDFRRFDELTQHQTVYRWIESARQSLVWIDTLPTS
jgi:hypothetical protein